jgi:hypothetical protein
MLFSELVQKVDSIVEKVVRKKVIRGGKKVIVKKSSLPGYEIKNGKEVRKTQAKTIQRSRSQRKASIKRKATSTRADVRRKRSLKRRTW